MTATVRFFGGTVAQVSYVSLGIERQISLRAQDYTLLANRTSIRKSYSRQMDSAVIKDAIMHVGRTEIDTSMVEDGRVVGPLEYTGGSLSSLMDQLIEITGYTWEIDAFKRLHYHPKPFIAGKFFFSDTPDYSASFPFYNPSYTQTLAHWNQVAILGASAISDNITDTYIGDGTQVVFILGQQGYTEPLLREPTTANDTNPFLLVEINTGTGTNPTWEIRKVATDTNFAPSVDVLWNPFTYKLTFKVAPPNLNNAFRVTGRTLAPAAVINRDSNAVARHGRVYEGSTIVPDATTIEQAQDIAIAYLRDYSDKDVIDFVTNKDGLETSSVTRLNSDILGIPESPIFVYGITTKLLGGEVAEHRVSAEILNTIIA